jgi:hypothetical protein
MAFVSTCSGLRVSGVPAQIEEVLATAEERATE